MEDVTSKDDKKQNEEDSKHSRAEDHTENDEDNEIPSKEIFPNPENTVMALTDTRTTRKQKGMKIETIQNHM
jgi:hypothetical protein